MNATLRRFGASPVSPLLVCHTGAINGLAFDPWQLWAFLRAMEGESRWAYVMWAAMATGLLLKGLIAMVFPVGAILLWLTLTRNWPQWRKLSPFAGIAIIIGVSLSCLFLWSSAAFFILCKFCQALFFFDFS